MRPVGVLCVVVRGPCWKKSSRICVFCPNSEHGFVVGGYLVGGGKGLVPVGTVVLSAVFCSGADAVVQLGFLPRNGRKFRANNRTRGCFSPQPPNRSLGVSVCLTFPAFCGLCGLRFSKNLFYREAGAGIEPAVELLQSSALPLGDPAATDPECNGRRLFSSRWTAP